MQLLLLCSAWEDGGDVRVGPPKVAATRFSQLQERGRCLFSEPSMSLTAPHAGHQASGRVSAATSPCEVCCRRSLPMRLGHLLGSEVALKYVSVVPAVRDASLLADGAPVSPLGTCFRTCYRLLERSLSVLQCLEFTSCFTVY